MVSFHDVMICLSFSLTLVFFIFSAMSASSKPSEKFGLQNPNIGRLLIDATRSTGLIAPPYVAPPSALSAQFKLISADGASQSYLQCYQADRYNTDPRNGYKQLPSPAYCFAGPLQRGAVSQFKMETNANGAVTLTGPDGGMLGVADNGSIVYLRPPGVMFGNINYFWMLSPASDAGNEPTAVMTTHPDFMGFGIGGDPAHLDLVSGPQLAYFEL